MQTSRLSLPAVAFLLASAVATLPAQSGADPKSATGLRKELIGQLADAEQKFVALAGAMPQEKFSWRPAAGVRSVSEVYMHVVADNDMILGMARMNRAPGMALARDAETSVTTKPEIVDLLKKSFANLKQAVMDVPDKDMDAAVKMFGQQFTKRGVLVLLTTHAHEHLGQSIAYARMNGVVPPWSQKTSGDR